MAPAVLHLPNGTTVTVAAGFGGLSFKATDLPLSQHYHMPLGWTIVLHAEDNLDHDDPVSDLDPHSNHHLNQPLPPGQPSGQQSTSPGQSSGQDSTPAPIQTSPVDPEDDRQSRARHTHRYRRPTLRNDALFISSISLPNSHEYQPAQSPTRHLAAMLWTTLWWYFHQPRPAPQLNTAASAATPEGGRPQGDWRIRIKRAGVFAGRHVLSKLERMGLVCSEDSSVGLDDDRSRTSYQDMFVSQRMFWQIDARIFLFTLRPATGSPFPAGSTPSNSRPSSPNRGGTTSIHGLTPLSANSSSQIGTSHARRTADDRPLSWSSTTPSLHSSSSPQLAPAPNPGIASAPNSAISPHLQPHAAGLWSPQSVASGLASPGPFTSASHLPTYYPPAPPQYVYSASGIRHPLRPKPPRQGETFYIRYVPSVGQYLSFRVACLSPQPVAYSGPIGGGQPSLPIHTASGVSSNPSSRPISPARGEGSGTLTPAGSSNQNQAGLAHASNPTSTSHTANAFASDAELLFKWMNIDRVADFWGNRGPVTTQEKFLREGLQSRHSFPVIGCWDGQPFGYFEIYWAREDRLGACLDGDSGGGGTPVGDYDRGFHALVGEDAFRGPARVRIWMSALVHYCWLADPRTTRVLVEPRVDNVKFIRYLQDVGFYQERQVALPHKQSALMKVTRASWEAPVL